MRGGFNKGFTVLEILVVIAIVAALAGIATVPLARFRQEQALQNSVNGLLTVINEARAKTLAGTDQSVYSVRLESSQAILFRGTSYSGTDVTNRPYAYETPVTLGTVSLSGDGSAITFDRLRGTTATHGTLQLRLPNGTARTITVTATGTVKRD